MLVFVVPPRERIQIHYCACVYIAFLNVLPPHDDLYSLRLSEVLQVDRSSAKDQNNPESKNTL